MCYDIPRVYYNVLRSGALLVIREIPVCYNLNFYRRFREKQCLRNVDLEKHQ